MSRDSRPASVTKKEAALPSGGRLHNEYFVCPIYQDEAEPWDPYTRDQVLEHNQLDYVGGILETVEESGEIRGLTFYITWKIDELPRYGSDVVAIVVEDEWGRYPKYANRVRAVFKMMGSDFCFEAAPLLAPPYLTLVTGIKYVRTQLLRMPSRLRSMWDRRPGARRAPAPIYDIPLGYYRQDDLPIKPFEERRHDLYFSGSIVNSVYDWHHPQSWFRTPKDISRRQLVDALYKLQEDHPNLDVVTDIREAFVPNYESGGGSRPERTYSEIMMDTRICPVPRGTRLETARLYEALRYGCVVIAEPLPDRWFLRDFPGIILHDWSKLPELVEELVSQPDRLNALHEDALSFWTEKCAEEPVGRYVVEQLLKLRETEEAVAA
jgi:hypothetical protein